MLLPPRKLPAWLNEAATEAERELTAIEIEDDTPKRSSRPSEGSSVGEAQ
jgi:hypothetical protein